ncbi:sigma 54-interacting transcriptional regulator [Nitrospira sp. MA-1]|nr:sigma 54-interacting transcriptional regulator [Nitrospira sp. MA-1]
MTDRSKTMALALAFSLVSTVLAFSVSFVFPQGERWLTDWQLAHMAPGPVDPSLVMVTVTKSTSPALCGEGRWDLSVLQSTLLALHEAGAAVIVPSIDASSPIASECGGLAGLVRLAEVTKRVGSVVYPDSVPPALADAATALGTLTLMPDADGVFRGVKSATLSADSSPHPPIGLVIASFVSKEAMTINPGAIDNQLRFVGRWKNPPFPTHDFSDVWNIIQSKDRDQLVKLFRGKAVILFSLVSKEPTLSTPWESAVPGEFLHALLSNAVLTNGWVFTTPVWVAFLVTVSVSLFFTSVLFWGIPLARFGMMSLAGIFLAGLALLWGLHSGWMRPILSTGLALGMAMGGTLAWRVSRSRSIIQERIIQGKQQLQQLEAELADRQQHVRELETHLHVAKDHAHHSATVIEGLETLQGGASRQLENAQSEIEETRRQIDRLEVELEDLRQQVPAMQHAGHRIPESRENLELFQECESLHILTRAPSVLRVFQDLKKASGTRSPILLLGETGTGKEVFARAAHALSPRHQGPFVSVNMAAIRSELFEGELFGHVKGAFTGAVGREGYIETANGGTLFLDEVGELPSDLQAKLLRFLEDGSFHRVGESRLTQVDVRIIAATNCNLQQDVEAGRYREDLYYRLRSIVLTLPPLRERGEEDCLLLAQSFLQNFSRQQDRMDLAFTQGALEAMTAYRWPGNIRELRQTVAQAVALANGSLITEADLHLSSPVMPYVKGEGHGLVELDRLEDDMVLECLRRHRFDMQATAKALGWDRSTVTQRLKGLGFQALVDYQGNIEAAAQALAGDENLTRMVGRRLREYSKNLLPSSKHYSSVEVAIADCRKRFRNLPERHFPAVEQLVRQRFIMPEQISMPRN